MTAPTAYIPLPSQWASASCHLEQRADWSPVYRVDGVRYLTVVSGTSGKRYAVRADARGCGCIWSQRAATPCSHRLAVELAATMEELQETAPASRLTIDDLMPACRICTEVAERDGLCDRCCAERTYTERIDGKVLAGSR